MSDGDAILVVRVDAAGVDAFLQFPAHLYRDDPCWVPPLLVWERRRLRAALSAEAGGLVLLTARRGGAVVGTISVRKDSTFAESGLVWFGYFECIPDAAVARALVMSAQEQARAWGGRVLRGPQNLSRFEFVGLTVAGHDRLPPLMQAHHPPYYAALLAGLLAPHHDVLAYETPLLEADGVTPRALPAALQEKVAAVDVPGLVLRAAHKRTMGADMEAAFAVLNAAYATVPDINPMSRATFMGLGRAMFTLAGPGLIQLAWQGTRPVGFAVCIPEVNEALARCRGRLLPTGWARLVRGLWGIETAAFKLIGVVPELRGSGLHAALIAGVVAGAQRAGYRRMDGSVIDERNGPMRGVVEGVGMTVYRRYRFYEGTLS